MCLRCMVCLIFKRVARFATASFSVKYKRVKLFLYCLVGLCVLLWWEFVWNIFFLDLLRVV